MKGIILLLLLFLLQLYLVFNGVTHFTKQQTPFIVLAVSLLIPACAFHILKDSGKHTQASNLLSTKNILFGGALGVVSVAIAYNSLRGVFDQYADYANGSDVILIMETMYQRFSKGILPYAPVGHYLWKPYPLYMPFNWLPTGLAGPLQCDVRWIGVLFLALSTAVWGIVVWSQKSEVIKKVISIALPSIVLWAYVRWDHQSLGVSLETLIAAYYIILAAGLATRNLALTTAGIILCLLSRFTMIFWLPLFFMILLHNVPIRTSIKVWGTVALSILVIYLIPFYFQDPTIFGKGLAYHNHCYVDMWNGLGNPEESTSFDNGLTFSWFTREYTTGSMEARVNIARTIQGFIMILFVIAGYAGYRRWKERINFYDYSLLMLYMGLLLFFMSSPVAFNYYYMPVLMVSAIVAGRCILSGRSGVGDNVI